MSLTIRTMKIALSACLAALLAQALGLQYAASAGIIAILSVLDTTKVTLVTARRRMVSAILALAIAAIVFNVVGFSILAIGVYLLAYVPLAYRFKLEAGIAPCSVLVSHLYLEQTTALPWLVNETMLMVVGAGIATIIVSLNRVNESVIESSIQEVDEQIRTLLEDLAQALRNGTMVPKEAISKLRALLEKAEQTVYFEAGNRLTRDDQYELSYLQMRAAQASILGYMRSNLAICSLPTEENLLISQLLERTAKAFDHHNPGDTILEDIDELVDNFRKRQLPASRDEFENRAILFQLLIDFRRFIETKKHFYESHGS